MLRNFLIGVALLIAVVAAAQQLTWAVDRQIIQSAQSGHGSGHAHGTAKTETPKTTQDPTKAKPTALQPADGAKIKILSPINNQVLTGDKVALQYQLTKGKRGHHAHAYIDGELVGMFESAKGTLNGVKPGKHVLELRVVAADHKTELDAVDKVEFTVK